ncbi:hypothetical protein HZH68_015074 [Vespula germanica]|uniref:Uncharacterized protein n=1 Tax=Vespula germanica TaxID=30212 RepID=A0A834MST7_VESGE|nr:hypothetical protein HZH68_015074 [Vespula germanica]
MAGPSSSSLLIRHVTRTTATKATARKPTTTTTTSTSTSTSTTTTTTTTTSTTTSTATTTTSTTTTTTITTTKRRAQRPSDRVQCRSEFLLQKYTESTHAYEQEQEQQQQQRALSAIERYQLRCRPTLNSDIPIRRLPRGRAGATAGSYEQ